MTVNTFVSAVIVAAGNSTRMNTQTPKQFLNLNGKPVLINTLKAFDICPIISEIIIVCRETDKSTVESLVKEFKVTKVKNIVNGGDTRQQSVFNGVAHINSLSHYIAIHDAARPFIDSKQIEDVINTAIKFNCASLAVPVKDTIKITNEYGFIKDTPERENLWAVQTPQVFKKNLYIEAMNSAVNQGLNFTDDCQLLERLGYKVKLCMGSYSNIKITTIEDLPQENRSMIKIGHGYDVHRLVENRNLILGGVLIPHKTGLLGHSDADVLVHSIIDALLGASGFPDIGSLFPDNDPSYSGADSLQLLKQVCSKIKNNGFSIINIDSTLIAEKPKMKIYLPLMRENIAETCNISIDQINIKATTEEGLGFSGEEKGIAAHAVCLLEQSK